MHHNNTLIGFVSGCLGGVTKYFLTINEFFITDLLGAVFTAVLCGAAGVAGKEGYLMVRRYIKNKKSNGTEGQN